jgi:DNA-binding PadR family transcriptional regulator
MFRNMFFHHHMRDRMRDCGGGGGPRHRGPKVFDAGALRYIVLQLIADRPRHGYEIIKEIEEQIGGGYSPSPGVIYPLLAMLQDQGFVTVTVDGNKNLHTITPEGLAFLEENRAFVDAIRERMSAKGRGGARDIRHSMRDLKVSIFKHFLRSKLGGEAPTPEQIAKINAILKKAIEDIERM